MIGHSDASIWYARVRDKECPLPADLAPLFTDSTYGNDVCPSYSTKDGHLMIWLHDKDTWEDAYGDPIGEEPRFQISYCPDGDVYGEDGHLVNDIECKTWEETVKKVRSLLEQVRA